MASRKSRPGACGPSGGAASGTVIPNCGSVADVMDGVTKAAGGLWRLYQPDALYET